MAIFSRILLCYDGTREGRRALLYGAELARERQAETHLLAVLDNAYWIRGFDALAAEAASIEEQSAREILAEGVKKLQACGVAAVGHLATGNAIDRISQVATQLNVDLIVLGHRRCGLLERWWAGQGHGLLLDKVPCSILVAIDPVETEAMSNPTETTGTQTDATDSAAHR
ncbi:universal stress protein [Cupriavidus necator]|uniref:Universal stress protein n=2 Tax=Cupriavidus necator TaxID=106590 RepID=A0A1U9UP52_CUPNE|nr:universal stress protein [Cupriavidus necator]